MSAFLPEGLIWALGKRNLTKFAQEGRQQGSQRGQNTAVRVSLGQNL